MNHFCTVAIAGCLAASCGSAPMRVAVPSGTVTTTLTAAEFHGLDPAKLGFDERSEDPRWESGDEVVYGLRLRRGNELHRWVLRLQVLIGEQVSERLAGDATTGNRLWDERTWSYTITQGGERRELTAKSLMLPVTAIISDEHDKKLSASLVKLPAHLLGHGVLPAIDCAVAAAASGGTGLPEEPLREVSVRPMVDATIAMMALLNVVQEDSALAEYFWFVVEKPSIWSVITGMGVHATLAMPFEESVPATSLPPGLPAAERAFVSPLQIEVNGSPALFVDVVVIDAARPYSLCGGMVAAVARHPTRPDVTLELQLLGARCGKP